MSLNLGAPAEFQTWQAQSSFTKSSTWKAPHKHLPEGGTKVNAGLATKSRKERWFADDVVIEDTWDHLDLTFSHSSDIAATEGFSALCWASWDS